MGHLLSPIISPRLLWGVAADLPAMTDNTVMNGKNGLAASSHWTHPRGGNQHPTALVGIPDIVARIGHRAGYIGESEVGTRATVGIAYGSKEGRINRSDKGTAVT